MKIKTKCKSCESGFSKEKFLFNCCPICKGKNLIEVENEN